MRPTREEPSAKVAFLEGVADAWNRRGIEYAVCHGIEGYPHSVGRDLDVVVRGKQLRQAARIASGYLSACGFLVLEPVKPWGGKWLFAFRQDLRLQIDLIPFLFRGPALFVASPHPTRRVGPFAVDPWASFAKRVLMPVLGGGPLREPFLGPGEEQVARQRCLGIFGGKLTRELFAGLHGQDAPALAAIVSRLRIASVLRASFLHPLRSASLFFPWLRKTLSPYLRRCAPIIAVVGPDGVGKTAVVQALSRNTLDPFCGFIARHWRPGVLPRPGSLLGRAALPPDAHGLPPRRRPGRLHWLRLAYYFVDFTLGHFLKDRPASSRLQVVLYDRHALDMAVDPVRYGLSSSRGIRLFWRLIPKPDLIVLLFDEPRRIRSRKEELEEAEIERQLQVWLRLAGEGQVGALIRVDGGAEQAAGAVNELILEAFVAGSRRGFSGQAGWRQWLSSILGAPAAPDTGPGRMPGAAYGRIALSGGRQYLIPVGNRRAALAAMRLYRPQKAMSRLASGLLSAAIRWGPAARLLPKACLPASGELLDFLKSASGRQDLTLGISTGAAGPPRKPVLLLMNAKGVPLGYAKVGWNEQTRLLVESERRALEFFALHSPAHGQFPGVLHFGACGQWKVLVTEPLELSRGRADRPELEELHIQFLLEVAEAGLKREKFGQSAFFSGILAGLLELRGRAPSYQLRLLEDAIDLMSRKLGCVEMPFVWRLGDFVPWNISIDRRAGKIQAVDLEYAAPQEVPGWDLFHFSSQPRSGLKPWFEEKPAAGASAAWKYFQALQIDPQLVPWLRAAYLASLWTLWTRLWSAPGIQKSAAAPGALRGKSNQLFLLLETLRAKGAAAQ
jgi:thymidylate kinase